MKQRILFHTFIFVLLAAAVPSLAQESSPGFKFPETLLEAVSSLPASAALDSLWNDEKWTAGAGTPGADNIVRAVTWSDGDLFVGGEFRNISGKNLTSIGRFHDGAWSALGDLPENSFDGTVHAIAVDGDNVYVGGQFTIYRRPDIRNIAVWNRKTNTWSPLSKGIGGLNATVVFAMLVHDGDLYVAGRFVVAGTIVSVNIARWDGERWHRVGTGINDQVDALATDGEYLYAGGEFTIAGDERAERVARYEFSSGRWSAMGASFEYMEDKVAALAVDDEYVYVGGRFGKLSGKTMNNLARWKKSTGEWSDLKEGVTNDALTTRTFISTPDGITPVVVRSLLLRGEDLFVGGNFMSIVSMPETRMDSKSPGKLKNIAKWQTGTDTWSTLPISTTQYPGVIHQGKSGGGFATLFRVDASIEAMGFDNEGEICIGGDFTGVFAGDNSFAAPNLCKLTSHDTVWSPIGSGGFDGPVLGMVSDNTSIYAVGSFDYSGTVQTGPVARFDKEIGRWEPMGNISGKMAEVVDGGESIYVGGERINVRFTTGGGFERVDLVRWDKTSRTWSRVGENSPANVSALAYTDGRLYVGSPLMIWDGTSWDSIEVQPDGIIQAIAVDGDNVYVGGKFATIGDDSVNNVAVWNRTTRQWSPLGTGVTNTDPQVVTEVRTMIVWNGSLYAGGNFTTTGSRFIGNVATYNPTNQSWNRVGSRTFGNSRTVVNVLHPATYGLYAGGEFDEFIFENGTRPRGIALFDGTLWRALGSGISSVPISGNGTTSYGTVFALTSDAEHLQVAGDFNLAGDKTAANYAEWQYPAPGGTPRKEDEDLPSAAALTPGVVRDEITDQEKPGRLPSSPAPLSNEPNPDDAHWDDRFAPDVTPTGTDDDVFALAAAGDSVFVGGAFSKVVGLSVNAVALWNGIDWEALDDGSAVGINGIVFALKLVGDDLYVGGQFSQVGGLPANNIAVWNMKTRSWRTFGGGLTADEGKTPFVSDIEFYNGELYVGGFFSHAGETSAQSIARWDGTSWMPLGAGVDGNVTALEIYKGKLYAGGSFGQAGEVGSGGIAYWDGSQWHGMQGGVDGVVNAMTVYTPYQEGEALDEVLMIGGDFTRSTESTQLNLYNLVRWTVTDTVPEGSFSFAFNSGDQTSNLPEIRALCADSLRLFVGGSFDFSPSTSQSFRNGNLKNIGYCYSDEPGFYAWLSMQGSVNAPVNAVVKAGNYIYAGGSFSRVGQDNIRADGIARWHARYNRWEPLLSAYTLGNIYALTLLDGDIYAGGPFFIKQDPRQLWDDDNYLARLGAHGWHLIDGKIQGNILDVETFGDEVIIVGRFFVSDEKIAVNVARWDAEQKKWSALTPGSGVADQEELAYAMAVVADDRRIYLGGLFSVVDTFETPHVAYLDRTTNTWHPLGDGLDGRVTALALGDDGTLYAGGDFSHSGSRPMRGVARWDGTAWQPMGEGIDGDVRSLLARNGKLYVGGVFDRAGDKDVTNVAVWDEATKEWNPMGGGLGSDFYPSVDVLAMSNGTLFAAGFFKASGTDSIDNVARWDGDRWSGLGSGVDFSVHDGLVDGGDVYFAGTFRRAGGKPSQYIALWHDPTLSVEERPEPPVAGELRGGAPNPFASATTIRYNLPRHTHVRMGIYDVRGVELERLIDGDEESGEHRIEWRPDVSLSAGVYIVRMEVEGQVLARKIIRR